MEKSRAGKTVGSFGGSRVKILVPRCSSEHKLVPSFSRILFIEKKTPRKWQELAVLVDMCWSSSLFFGGAGLVFFEFEGILFGHSKAARSRCNHADVH